MTPMTTLTQCTCGTTWITSPWTPFTTTGSHDLPCMTSSSSCSHSNPCTKSWSRLSCAHASSPCHSMDPVSCGSLPVADPRFRFPEPLDERHAGGVSGVLASCPRFPRCHLWDLGHEGFPRRLLESLGRQEPQHPACCCSPRRGSSWLVHPPRQMLLLAGSRLRILGLLLLARTADKNWTEPTASSPNSSTSSPGPPLSFSSASASAGARSPRSHDAT